MDSNSDYLAEGALRSLWEHLLAELRYFDGRAIREKRRALLLQLAQVLSLAAVPVLIEFGRRSDFLLTIGTALSVVALAVTALLQAFKPGSRFEQYQLMRLELRKLLFDLEVLQLEAEAGNKSVDATQFRERITELIERRKSIWSIVEPSATEIKSIGKVAR